MLKSTVSSPLAATRQGSYFFLSYAHSPPLASSWQGTEIQLADPDRWVRDFFEDLTRAVSRHASPRSGLDLGFFDQDIPLGSDWKASLTDALSMAEVFVPLYSPGYFARSLPGREWACFQERLSRVGLHDPVQRSAPVLWIPLPGRRNLPGLKEALDIGGSEPAYAENGLRALLRIASYRGSYNVIVNRVARRVVDLAESAPLRPSSVPDIDDVQSPFSAEEAMAVFAVAVAAPPRGKLPADHDLAGYGDRSTDWRPFPRDQERSLADYAARVAEQLDFAVLVTGIEKTGDLLDTKPGIILIDPWFIADDQRLRLFKSFVQGLPEWILPLLIVGSPEDARTTELAQRVRTILVESGPARSETASRAIRGVSSLNDFTTLVPILVTEAERQYLRHGPIHRSTARPGSRPRLAGDPASPPQPGKEEGEDV